MGRTDERDKLHYPEAGERIYPCARCGKLRSKYEGGTVFTVCDACWNAIEQERKDG